MRGLAKITRDSPNLDELEMWIFRGKICDFGGWIYSFDQIFVHMQISSRFLTRIKCRTTFLHFEVLKVSLTKLKWR